MNNSTNLKWLNTAAMYIAEGFLLPILMGAVDISTKCWNDSPAFFYLMLTFIFLGCIRIFSRLLLKFVQYSRAIWRFKRPHAIYLVLDTTSGLLKTTMSGMTKDYYCITPTVAWAPWYNTTKRTHMRLCLVEVIVYTLFYIISFAAASEVTRSEEFNNAWGTTSVIMAASSLSYCLSYVSSIPIVAKLYSSSSVVQKLLRCETLNELGKAIGEKQPGLQPVDVVTVLTNKLGNLVGMKINGKLVDNVDVNEIAHLANEAASRNALVLMAAPDEDGKNTESITKGAQLCVKNGVPSYILIAQDPSNNKNVGRTL